jgi:outer membrane biogenesis lipoprotein LolB
VQHFPSWVRGEPHEGAERIYVLGDRIQERLLYEYLKAWQLQFPHWEVTVGEPLPPYHFV